MKKQRRLFVISATILLMITIACDISFSPSNSEREELSEAEIALTNQAMLQTSVAQTVEALDLDKESESDQPSEEAEQDDPAPDATATSTPLPCNKPKFQNETIPDNSVFDPGDTFTKTWTVRNDGTCSWTTDYKLVFSSGDQMGGASSKNFANNVNPGESVTLSVDLTAPASDGTYTGTWKIKANDGEQFGNYWTTIIVGAPESEPGETFAVTGVSFSGDQMKVGWCPHTFNFQAEITTNGAGKVKYHWVISNGYEGDVKTATFDSAETKTVTLSKSLACSGTSTCSYIVELYIDSPNHQMFGGWPIAIHCL